MTLTTDMIEREAGRLYELLSPVHCPPPPNAFTLERCRGLAPLTLEINRLKAERGAIILAHSYVAPEISYGVADFRGDSYQLSLQAKQARAKTIVFVGVVFMAETAKILAPEATVIVPDRNAGCSLADALTGDDVRALKSRHPDATVVCYINTTADVKAESDVCVTSGNAAAVLSNLPDRKILFVPDRLMGQNLSGELRRRGVDKEIVVAGGSCVVHDKFAAADLPAARKRYPGLKVLVHPECPPEVVQAADFVGGTEAMMNYVKTTSAPSFWALTDAGLVARLEVETRGKLFVGERRTCPFMQLNTLEQVRTALAAPREDQIIRLDERVRLRAERCLARMFELTATH